MPFTNIITTITARIMIIIVHVLCTEEMKNAYKILTIKYTRKRPAWKL
jgi:hypothetical protein